MNLKRERDGRQESRNAYYGTEEKTDASLGGS